MCEATFVLIFQQNLCVIILKYEINPIISSHTDSQENVSKQLSRNGFPHYLSWHDVYQRKKKTRIFF